MTTVQDQMKKWDWNFVFAAERDIQTEMDDPTWRFIKSEVISRAIQVASRGEAVYVDEVGHDFLLNDEVRIELKRDKKAFNKSGDTKWLQLKNTRADAQQLTRTFDYLLIVQSTPPFRASIATFDDVNQNIRVTNDQIQAKIPENCLIHITPKSGFEISKTTRERLGFNRRGNSLHTKIDFGINRWLFQTYDENLPFSIPGILQWVIVIILAYLLEGSEGLFVLAFFCFTLYVMKRRR